MIKQSTTNFFAILFGVLFLLTLVSFIAYAFSMQGEFKRGMDAAATLSDAEEFFLGDDDPHTAVLSLHSGYQVHLEPASTYKILVNTIGQPSRFIGSIGEVSTSILDSTFYQTTNPGIVGLHNGADRSQEKAFVDPVNEQFILLDDNAFGSPDTIYFEHSDNSGIPSQPFTITTNIPESECSDLHTSISELYPGYESFEGFVTECNKTGSISASTIYVDGEVAYEFTPVELTRVPGGVEGPMSYDPSGWIWLEGVSPDLQTAYFSFAGKMFALESDGTVKEVDEPSDLVKLTERYK